MILVQREECMVRGLAVRTSNSNVNIDRQEEL